ncbi:MAG: response regulator [Gemmatimonadetes bacterium]|nr:response regulator [Gemmatimonadota bacterium]MBT7419851.1 response regulator [Gemmatimonadota bacterium]MBT7549181.1 response regulator [Gemmatimonadota bacterium]
MSKVILVVDDDPVMRESVRDILEIENYKVIEAGDGIDGLPIVKKEHVDLVITDILMSQVDGNELVFKLKRFRPDLKVIGMTGGGRLVSVEQVKQLCPDVLFEKILTKPFLREELLAQVEAALA